MCLFTLDPVPKKPSSRKTRRDSSSSKPIRVINLPIPGLPTYPIPIEQGDFAGGWIAGQAHAEAQAQRTEKASTPPVQIACHKPVTCCHGKRRCSTASSISVRSFRQIKRKVKEICRKQDEKEDSKERDKRNRVQDLAEWERLGRVRDRRSFERLEKEVERDKERHRVEQLLDDGLGRQSWRNDRFDTTRTRGGYDYHERW